MPYFCIMRMLLLLVLCSIQRFGVSQQWQDSLRQARSLYKQQKYPESLKKYQAAQKLAPKSIDLSDEMGQTAYKAEAFEHSEKLYNQSDSKKASPTQQANTYHNIGNAKFKQKKYEEAVESYKEALRHNPDDEQTRYNLAEAMKKRDKQQQKTQSAGNQSKKEQQKKEQEKGGQQQNKQQSSDKKGNEKQNNDSNLSDKNTERTLDDLVKREMETKKKLGTNKGKGSKSKTAKDW